MLVPAIVLSDAQQNFQERLAVLRRARDLYLTNRHRSLPNRTPYATALRIAQEEFKSAESTLKQTLRDINKSRQIRSLRNDFRKGLLDARDEASRKTPGELIDLQKRQRDYLAKIQMLQELENTLFTGPARVSSAR